MFHTWEAAEANRKKAECLSEAPELSKLVCKCPKILPFDPARIAMRPAQLMWVGSS